VRALLVACQRAERLTRPRSLHLQRLADSLALLSSEPLLRGLDAQAVCALVSPSVRTALRCAAAQGLAGAEGGQGCSAGGELLLVLHVACAGGAVTVHVSPLRLPPRLAPVAASVSAASRPQPHAAKASAWVAQRAALADACPPDCAEVLLRVAGQSQSQRDQHGCCAPLTEGLVTNLFVLARDSATQTLRLHTASVEQGALPGVARAQVLAAAERLGIPVSLSAPRAPPHDGEALHRWQEAFLCNAVRLVQPLRELRWVPCAPGEPPPRPPLLLPHAPGPLTVALAEALEAATQSALSHDFLERD